MQDLVFMWVLSEIGETVDLSPLTRAFRFGGQIQVGMQFLGSDGLTPYVEQCRAVQGTKATADKLVWIQETV